MKNLAQLQNLVLKNQFKILQSQKQLYTFARQRPSTTFKKFEKEQNLNIDKDFNGDDNILLKQQNLDDLIKNELQKEESNTNSDSQKEQQKQQQQLQFESLIQDHNKYPAEALENQYTILNCDQTLENYLQIYKLNKETFNEVNYCTLFHHIVKVQLNQKNLTPKEQQLLKKSVIQFKQFKINELMEIKEVPQIIQAIKGLIKHMNGFAKSNFISNLAKINYFDAEIIKEIISLKDHKDFNLISISYCLWSLAKYKIKAQSEFIKFSEDYMLKYDKNFDNKSLPNLFYSLAYLGSRNQALQLKLEEQIIENSQKFDSTQINLIFAVYSKFTTFTTNYDVLDSLASRFMNLIQTHSMRNIANIVTYCSKLNYVNHQLFNTIEAELLRRLETLDQQEEEIDQITQIKENSEEIPQISEKELSNNTNEEIEQQQQNQKLQNQQNSNRQQTPQEAELILQQFLSTQPELQDNYQKEKNDLDLQNEQNNKSIEEIQKSQLELNTRFYQSHYNKELLPNIGKDKKIYDLSPMDASEILVGLCKLKITKTHLFEVLEYNFIKKIDQASPISIVSYAFAHSQLCTEMLMNYNKDKKAYNKRSLKNLKKYNHSFYEIVTVKAIEKIQEFSVDELISYFTSASRPLVKKNAICRNLVTLGVQGIPKLNQLGKSLDKPSIQKKQYEYFRMLQYFAFQNQQKDKIIEGFKQAEIDLEELMNKFGYIAPKVSTEALPKFNLNDLDFDEEEDLEQREKQQQQQQQQ